MRVRFTKSYKLCEQEIKFARGVVGVYFIYLEGVVITYPFRPSGLIYIGMSGSKQNSLSMRLRGHLTGQSGNFGIRNYAKKFKLNFTYYSTDVLSAYGSDNTYDLESFFIGDFLCEHGSHPICNGQAGHQLSDESKEIFASVDWNFFCRALS
ncbi:hypothetical protein CCR90_13555 [Rhodovulum sulfidophilum]|nr:hypothetical protein [Rhodovulum sulfidophilum]